MFEVELTDIKQEPAEGSEWQEQQTVGNYQAENLHVVESAYNEPHLQPVVEMKKLTDAQLSEWVSDCEGEAESCFKEEDEEEFIQLFNEFSQNSEKDVTQAFSLQQSIFRHSAEISQSITLKNELSIQSEDLNELAVDLDNYHFNGQTIRHPDRVRNVSKENAVIDVSDATNNTNKLGKHAAVASKLDMVVPSSDRGPFRTDDREIVSGRIPEMSYRTQSSGKHHCTVCGAKFVYHSRLERHMMIHTGEKPFSCRFCDKKFRLKSLLKPHELSHTGNLQQCNLCGGRFRSLKKHMMNVHSAASYDHFCCVCKKGFRAARYLRWHMLTHTDERPYTCQDCGGRFRTLTHLKTHLLTHTKEKNYICNVCGKKFSQTTNLNIHMRVHCADKPYCCETCDRAFKYPSALSTHRLMHTSGKQICLTCGKAFRQRAGLKRHALIHSGEQPYECSECGMRFNQSSSMQRHKLTHTGDQPYSCSDCGQRFTQSGGLCSHRRKHCHANKTQT